MVSVSNFNGLKDNITKYLSHGRNIRKEATQNVVLIQKDYVIIRNIIGKREEILILRLYRE